jgi:hypothetical protein
VTIEFHKNRICAQCVNCSGRVVAINVVISDLKVSNCAVRLQIHVTVPFFLCMRYKLLLWHVKILYFYDRKYHTFQIFSCTLKMASTGDFKV